MKFQSFSRVLPAIAALFTRQRTVPIVPSGSPSNPLSYRITGADVPSPISLLPSAPVSDVKWFHRTKNQRKERKAVRRRIAAGFKF